MKKYGKALIWAAIIIAVALLAKAKGMSGGVSIALVTGISFVAINSIFPGNRWTRGCWPCGSGKA
ncbi:MAG: hypothetical protein A3J40_02545 [Erythrobacter sp. RIFCSPHIGHO2_12_FULL_63_10]|nr:MAG: hypothetical protein A3J40_02545 [Erythrobacter sp. RIFCSPHIGHO2_12_FULL_63_10]